MIKKQRSLKAWLERNRRKFVLTGSTLDPRIESPNDTDFLVSLSDIPDDVVISEEIYEGAFYDEEGFKSYRVGDNNYILCTGNEYSAFVKATRRFERMVQTDIFLNNPMTKTKEFRAGFFQGLRRYFN